MAIGNEITIRKNTPSLRQVFVDIADSIRYLSGESDTITPWDLGNYIRSIAYFELEDEPDHTLPAIFQDIADSIRQCGIEGTMTPPEMAAKIRSIKLAHTLENYCADEFVGKTMYCMAFYDGQPTEAMWLIVSGYQYATINQNGRIDVNPGVENKTIRVSCRANGIITNKTITVTYDNQLSIECWRKIKGRGNVIARYNGEIVTPIWNITSGTSRATISNDGTLTVLKSGKVTLQATYNGYTTTKKIQVEYSTKTITKTIIERDGSVTSNMTRTVPNQDGSTTATTYAIKINVDGYFSQTDSVTETNPDGSYTMTSTTVNQDGSSSETNAIATTPAQDGSSTETSNTTYYDSNHDIDGTQTGTTQKSGDGSSTTLEFTYNANGDLIHRMNGVVDVDGVASTQDIDYDGEKTNVTGYTIDTYDSIAGSKNFYEEGVNTGFYAFDTVEGFIMNIRFRMDFTNQPPDQNEEHHQILQMKRAQPSPWYGFQLRQDKNNKYIYLGTQFEFGSNTNTNINPQGANWIVENQIAEFNLQVTYDPTLFSNTFVLRDLITNRILFTSDYVFPDLPELRYLTICLGYALDEDGNPYRYSNMDILNFSIEKLIHPPATPVLAFSDNTITISCETPGSEIWYKLGGTSIFSLYTQPIEITEDTLIQAYSKASGHTSEIAANAFLYDDGIDEPTITCDGEFVEINCGTSGATVYYRVGRTGEFVEYMQPFEIEPNTNVMVQAYAVIDELRSDTVSQTVMYIPIEISQPSIRCNDNLVIITCTTPRAQIYYRLNLVGEFQLYEEPFTINADTYVEAYSTHGDQTSETTHENCVYTPEYDFSTDYLQFKALTGGTICWKAFGGLTKTIEYKINNGEWTSITSSSAGETIPVQADDIVKFRGNNTQYATSKSAYSGFEGGTATYDIQGNIMSLLYGDGFASNSSLPGSNSNYCFCSLFKKAPVVSAKNLILPVANLVKDYCYRAMFSYCTSLIAAPELPATTLSRGCYWYMFERCSITKAPVLNAATLVNECYGHMFDGCSSLNTIECHATSGFNATNCLQNWTTGVAGSGTFVKNGNASDWTTGTSGIPEGWIVCDDILLYAPTISFDGETIELYCSTEGASIYYRLDETGEFQLYETPITILQDTILETYSSYQGHTSQTITRTCVYVQETKFQQSNKSLPQWRYGGNVIETPFSVNRIDGHSSSYAKGTFAFETYVVLKAAQPTYLWFQHADQSADIYVDDVKVGTHWGGYNAFFFDISEYVHRGTNNIKVALCNTTRSSLAPAAGDFNFNATLGNVKLFTSPCLPAMKYGYDGFHITSTVNSSSATVNVKTTVPSGAQLVCTITDGTYNWTDTKTSNGEEQTFTTTISGANFHLWEGTANPYLYTVKLEIYKDGDLYHRYERPYGFRYYSYVINQTINGQSYTGFLLNGQPYYLRGVCLHDDIAGKANALNDADYTQEFAIIQELGCNFLRLAHYPHPKEVYDWCDRLGLIVQTEAPCVNKFQSTLPEDYFTHLTTQYTEMVQQHFNHPCIMFWGLSNETSTDNKEFGKQKIEEYCSLIKGIDTERLVGYVMSHSYNNPASYYQDPNVDWFGSNLYVGWYIEKSSNDPTSALNTRIANTVTRLNKPLALSEYGCGGTQHCHSDDFRNTTTTGNYVRHDIEYMMWLHEGHVAAIRNFPQLLFTGQWQLFDIAVSNRNEGYTICLDGENTSTDDNLKRLNNKGLVERDHVTKKDPFYLYKAEWSSQKFVHICGKDYTKITDRVLKCYTNDGNSLSLYEGSNATPLETVSVTNHIATFTARNYTAGVTYKVVGSTTEDTVTF